MPHDNSYKLLFSHPEMVRDLIVGFIHEDWVSQLDFTTLEKVSGTYISDELRDREDDLIWRVRWGDNHLYIYLLLEFQSKVDRFMAVRIMAYVALLYQDLIRQKLLTPDNRLPPVLPIVLYNGERRWRAPQNIADLVEPAPAGLERYRPALHYLLLDEGAIIDTDQPWKGELHNLVGALFRLEYHRNEQDLVQVLASLVEWLKSPQQSQLRRAFTVWIRRVLLPARAPDLDDISELQELHEVHDVLEERVKSWHKRWEQQGIERGIQQGMQEGIERGIQKGMQEGIERGIQKGMQEGIERGLQKGMQQGIELGLEQGLEQGIQQAARDIAKNLISTTDLDNATIAKVTGLSEDELNRLRQDQQPGQ